MVKSRSSTQRKTAGPRGKGGASNRKGAGANSRARKTASRKAPSRKGTGGPSRTQVVWGALCLAMTAVGGSLWMLDGQRDLGPDGFRIPSLVAADPTSGVDQIFETRAPMQDSPWQAIVIHHSASTYASPDSIDREHRAMGLAGLGYHFVVGNGAGAGDGDLHVGYRWLDQLPGAHTAGQYGDWYNRNAIGICLVGDGDRREFTGSQMARLVQTVRALQRKFGIPAENVILHSDVAGTTSPGRYFPLTAFREQLLTGAN